MFGENLIADLIRFIRAFLTNQYARLAPRAYIELTEQTGRGSEPETVEDIAEYFRESFADYFLRLDIQAEKVEDFLRGRHVLEYGPGDLPGVALLMYAYGAEKVYCVDRFPLIAWSDKNIKVMRGLVDSLPDPQRQRAKRCFNQFAEPASGLSAECIEYLVRPSGLCGLKDQIDLIYSRAVLEHVDDLYATFRDMDEALTGKGVGIHKVDLKSHGLHRANPLDFLTWPQVLWHLMFSHKGVPNRCRINQYREALAGTSLKLVLLEPTEHVDSKTIAEVKPYLAKPFQSISDEDLSWLGFWIVFDKTK